MSETSGAKLSVAGLFAAREARRRQDREAEEQLKQRKEEALLDFRQRMETFEVTDERVQAVFKRIEDAFERGETELMLTAFPCDFCTDDGRAIVNAGAPPINKPSKQELAARADEPEWLATLPAGVRSVYDYWKKNLQSGGFTFAARIISYPDGKPGDVGLFLGWPKSALEG